MMNFKEIDERILHFEEEIDWCVDAIKSVDKSLNNDINEEETTFLKIEKTKMEFFCFVTTSYIDLLCTYRNLKRSKSNWEKNYNIKIAYLVIYETINTYHKYKGEIFKIVSKEKVEFYKGFFDMLNRELSDFKHQYEYDKIIPQIRNKSTAHYDRTFLDYYLSFDLLKKVDSKEIIREFLYFINPLHYFTFGLAKGEIDQYLFINSWMI